LGLLAKTKEQVLIHTGKEGMIGIDFATSNGKKTHVVLAYEFD